jgi:RNA polymerase sigma factor (sigma-70 family)
MSAALQLPAVWAGGPLPANRAIQPSGQPFRQSPRPQPSREPVPERGADLPPQNLAFYRRHADRLLRRYLYASMQVGRAPTLLSDPVGRGWASSRPVRTFEDALIFVLDVERCLNRLDSLDREILSRIVLQAYTQEETAALLGMSTRTVSTRLGRALDRLTQQLLDTGLLFLPE